MALEHIAVFALKTRIKTRRVAGQSPQKDSDAGLGLLYVVLES